MARHETLRGHGNRDAQVIKDADHQMSAESDRVTLLLEIEAFLGANIP